MICKDCGRMCLPSEGYIKDDEFYCDKCATECSDCGEVIVYSYEDCYTTNNGDVICESCMDDRYEKCCVCGEIHLRENMYWIEEEEAYVCSRCVEDYEICRECGEYHSVNNMIRTIYDDYVCDRCYDNRCYGTCEDCGLAADEYDIFYSEEDDCTYCCNCADEHESSVIYKYHEYDDFELKERINEETDEYFGFELEVSGNKDYAEGLQELMPDVVLMNDSSIEDGGFEIISQPMSRRYIKEVFKKQLDEGLEFLRDNGFKGHNKGGMHVHISAGAFSNGQLAQLANILYGDEDDIKTWLIISQRSREKMERWSSMDDRILDYDSIINSPYSMPYILENQPRYTALNRDTRTQTYEIRIFNSNTRTERVIKNLECTFALIDYTKKYEDTDCFFCNTKGFINYVYENKENYPTLYGFMEERKVKDRIGEVLTAEELEAA